MISSNFKFSQPAAIDISIVIVSFNTREILLSCLDSIHRQTGDTDYEVIVIDNASEDGTVKAVTEQFLDVTIIANKDNRGFSAANNQGIILSKGRKIAFLNPDTILTENSFKKINTYMDAHPEFSILGCGITDKNNQPCPIRLWEDTPQDALLKILGIYDPSQELKKMGKIKTNKVQAISGCCFVVERGLFELIGLMDENYFLYNEEDDLCRRARQKGKKICFFQETSVQHLHGQSTHQGNHREKVIMEAYRSNLYFFSKYYSQLWNFVLRILYKIVFFAGLFRSVFRYFMGSATTDDSLSLKIKMLLMGHK